MDINELKKQMANNRTENVMSTLLGFLPNVDNDLNTQVLTLSSKWKDIKKKSNLGLIDNGEATRNQMQINYAILELLNELESNPGATAPKEAVILPTASVIQDKAQSSPHVFISYNHNDKVVANKLREKLKENNIEVTIDSEKMNAGEDIQEFIEKCVKDSNITISIVSKKSLLSAWVAMESINTFFHEKTSDKKFIACYIEDDFFKRNFTDDALDIIEAEVTDLRELITKRMEKGRNIRDLQNELTRYTNLNHNIDEIIRRLRESLCIDIKDENFDTNFNRILNAINN